VLLAEKAIDHSRLPIVRRVSAPFLLACYLTLKKSIHAGKCGTKLKCLSKSVPTVSTKSESDKQSWGDTLSPLFFVFSGSDHASFFLIYQAALVAKTEFIQKDERLLSPKTLFLLINRVS
jgi:hypothetical protein